MTSGEDELSGALETALDHVEAAGDSRIERITAEDEAADILLDALVDAVANGMSFQRVGPRLEALADATSYTKTQLRDLFTERRVDTADGASLPLPVFLDERLIEVQVARSTDQRQDTHYSWRFDTFTIQTSAAAGSRYHFSPDAFAKEIYAEASVLPTTDDVDTDLWDATITEIIEDKGTETEVRGASTTAVDELQNYVRSNVAYGTAEAAGERNGIFLPDPDDGRGARSRTQETTEADGGEEWHGREIWIPNDIILSTCEEWDLRSAKGLQMELDARGHTAEWNRGASYSTYVNGEKRTYWVLTPDFAEPVDFVEQPVDPAEKTARRIER